MKNSIFKSYSKKILKSEAFISVIIVFVLALGIIGTSYALYMDVDKDTDYQLVTVGDLSIGFDNGDNTINLTNMTPTEDEIAIKQTDNIFSFYIYNTGTYTADYTIKLETIDGNEVDTNYINYQICKDNANNCKDINTLSNTVNNIINEDILAPKKENDKTNPSVYYFLRIWINNQYKSDVAKTIKLKVVIDAKNANGNIDNNNTLVNKIINNNKINNETPDFNLIETEEKGLYKTKDDYGTSYYFRGSQNNNYIDFNNMCYRIVRIDGNSNIKLILEDKDNNCETSDGNWNIEKGNYDLMLTSLENFQTNNLNNVIDKLVPGNWCLKNIENIEEYKTPSLVCGENIVNKYSDNKDMYVGTITLDELMFAGAKYNGTSENGEYYLNSGNNLSAWT